MAFGFLRNLGKSERDSAASKILQVRQQRIEISRQALAENISQEMYELAVRNCAVAANGLLTCAAVKWRTTGDALQAHAQLAAGSEFLIQAATVTELASKSGLSVSWDVLGATDDDRRTFNRMDPNGKTFVYVANFRDLLLLALLNSDWGAASRLALCASSPVVIDGTSLGEPYLARLLLALVQRDATAFQAYRPHLIEAWKSPKTGDTYFLNTYFRYDNLMAAILMMDAPMVNALLADFDGLFVARGSDKRLKKGNVLDGIGSGDNRLVFDVWATALARYARHCGLQVAYDSQTIPTTSFG